MTNKKCISVSAKILVRQNTETVFNYFANPANDKHWRKEVNDTLLHGSLQAGVTVSEYAYLSKKAPNNLIELTCMQFDRNSIAVFETPDNAPFYEKSQRQVRAVSNNTTEITYTLYFDKDMVAFALGFALPRFIIAFKANSDMRKYLHQLKTKLEGAAMQ